MAEIKSESVAALEISILEQQSKYANDLRESILKATDELRDSYLGLISAKEGFESIKKENLDEIRRFKHAISSEAKEICANVKLINDVIGKGDITKLLQFVEVCNRIRELRDSGFFDTVKFL